MRRVMRAEANDAYWDRRWREAGRDADTFDDLNVYPIRFAEMVMDDRKAEVLEVGTGLGRVLKHYHQRGFRIAGVERSAVAVQQLREENAELSVVAGDVRALPFASHRFDVVLAFGVYHNIEVGMDDALMETARVLKPGGRFCISMRPDNLEMRLNEWYWGWQRRRRGAGGGRVFHKWLVTAREFKAMLTRHGLMTEEVHTAQNVSLLYRLPWLRARQADESIKRSQGYRLNAVGRAIDGLSMKLMPGQRANALVFVGSKVATTVPDGDAGRDGEALREVRRAAAMREREVVGI